MADIFTSSSVYQGTFQITPIESEPIFQICAVANINASNQLEVTYWINRNGERIDSDLGLGSYVVRDKSGNLVSGVAVSNTAPDVNGYYHPTIVSAANIFDLTHYVMELSIVVDNVNREASIGLVTEE